MNTANNIHFSNKILFFVTKLQTKFINFLFLFVRNSVKKELRYEERAVYNFRTRVFDIVGNSGSVVTIVEVTDEPSLDPVWVTPFATARFPEKQAQVNSILFSFFVN